MSKDRCKAALAALALGLRPIPCGKDKKPLVAWKPYQEQAPTADEVREWWTIWPRARLAVLTGTPGGLDVLDFDVGHAAWPGNGQELPTTCVTRTPTGGTHYLFRHTDGVRNSASTLARGVDVRGEGGYVLIPPSPGYSVVLGNLHEALATNPPGWLRDELLAASRGPRGQTRMHTENEQVIVEGTRNTMLTSLAGTMRRRGMSQEAIEAALRAENETRCDPPLDEREVRRIAASIGKYPAAKEARPKTNDDTATLGTDLGNAARLVGQHRADLLYCGPWGKWLVWDGVRWNVDADLKVMRYAKAVALSIYDEAKQADGQRQQDLSKWALTSQRRERLNAMVDLARCELAVSPAGLDTDGWLLNVLNGTVDLRAGKLREHRREDLITKLAPVRFDPLATCPLWHSFLQRIMDGNAEMISYLQRIAGMCLTGDVREHCLFIFWGPGRNGKNTFLDTITGLGGDYAGEAPPDLLIMRRSEEHPTEVADLCGKRLVVAAETEQGGRLRVQLIKRLTGNARLKARFMRQDYFEFPRTHKLILLTNNKPIVRENTVAIWDRLRLVPFRVYIPEPERDPLLGEKLITEWPGVLNWGIQGCLDWQRNGLQTPDAVESATQEYRDEQDPLKEFLDTQCLLMRDAWTSRAEAFKAYQDWAEGAGERFRLGRTEFYDRLRQHSVIAEAQRRVSGKVTRGFEGIGLLEASNAKSSEAG